MLSIGDPLPAFDLMAVDADGEFIRVTDMDHQGCWRVLFFWPKDFTFVCPTEISGFRERFRDFIEAGCAVLGCSTDSEYVHRAWRESHPALRDLPFPMLADIKRDLTGSLGILHPDEGVALRATFIVDPNGVIRFASVNDLNVGRNVDEVWRVLLALQSDGLTACNWQPGQANLVAT